MNGSDAASKTRIERGDYMSIGEGIERIYQDPQGVFRKLVMDERDAFDATPIPQGLEIIVLRAHSGEYLPSVEEAFNYALGMCITDTQPEEFLREVEAGKIGVELPPFGSSTYLVPIRLYKITERKNL